MLVKMVETTAVEVVRGGVLEEVRDVHRQVLGFERSVDSQGISLFFYFINCKPRSSSQVHNRDLRR